MRPGIGPLTAVCLSRIRLLHADQNSPDKITDADLLAPRLLNVPIPVRTYYGLQAVRATLRRALPPLDTPALADASVTTRRSVWCDSRHRLARRAASQPVLSLMKRVDDAAAGHGQRRWLRRVRSNHAP